MKKSIKAALAAALLIMTAKAYSQEIFDYTQNPFGLVYEGAITENVPGEVNIHPVVYNLNGNQIAANVYTPAGYDPQHSYAAIVVSHPNGGVKEQTAGLYAQRLAGATWPSPPTPPIRARAVACPAISMCRRTVSTMCAA